MCTSFSLLRIIHHEKLGITSRPSGNEKSSRHDKFSPPISQLGSIQQINSIALIGRPTSLQDIDCSELGQRSLTAQAHLIGCPRVIFLFSFIFGYKWSCFFFLPSRGIVTIGSRVTTHLKLCMNGYGLRWWTSVA